MYKHPGGTFDRWYGEDKRLKYAEECELFSDGDAICLDVEMENFADLTYEQAGIFANWSGRRD